MKLKFEVIIPFYKKNSFTIKIKIINKNLNSLFHITFIKYANLFVEENNEFNYNI